VLLDSLLILSRDRGSDILPSKSLRVQGFDLLYMLHLDESTGCISTNSPYYHAKHETNNNCGLEE
jgi:hypothetical protein